MKLSDVTGNFTGFKKEQIQSILFAAINALISPFFNLLIALVIIRNYGAFLWGDFLQIFLWLGIGAYLTSFGSKEYLLRKFKIDPSDATSIFQSSVKARFPLVLIIAFSFIALPWFGLDRALWMSVWLLFRFVYQSYNPISVWKEKLKSTIIIEFISGLLLLLYFEFRQGSISSLEIIKFFTLAEILKSFLMIIYYRTEFPVSFSLGIDSTQLKESLPLFVVGLAGLLHSRIDQLIGTAFLTKPNLAFYEVIMTMLLLCHTFAYYLLQFFVTDMYSLSEQSINKISLQLLLIGGLLTPCFVLMIIFILDNYYHFKVSSHLIIAAFLFILSFFYMIPYIYSLYRMKEDKKMFFVNILVIIINLIALPFIFPAFGISGAIIFAAAIQLIQALTFRLLAQRAF